MGNLKQPLTTLHVQLGCIPGKESQNYETWNLYRVTGTSAFQRERWGERERERESFSQMPQALGLGKIPFVIIFNICLGMAFYIMGFLFKVILVKLFS